MEVSDAYRVIWEDGKEADYDVLNDVVAEVVARCAVEDDWASVAQWGQMMNSGEFAEMDEETAINVLEESYTIDHIETLVIKESK